MIKKMKNLIILSVLSFTCLVQSQNYYLAASSGAEGIKGAPIFTDDFETGTALWENSGGEYNSGGGNNALTTIQKVYSCGVKWNRN